MKRSLECLAAGTALTVALTGCAEQTDTKPPLVSETVPSVDIAQPLPQCYDQPLPPTSTALEATPKSSRLNLKMGITGTVEDVPPLPPFSEHLRDALVTVKHPTPDGRGEVGSGSLVTNIKGETVVVTAAHVAGGTPVKGLEVLDDQGHKAHVTGGCEIFENSVDGKPSVRLSHDPSERAASADVAILRLDSQIGKSVLNVSAEMPKRGDFLYVAGYRGGHGPGTSTEFPGVVTRSYGQTLQLLTGLRQFPTMPDPKYGTLSTQFGPGDSGGPIVNNQEQVVAIGTGSNIYGESSFYSTDQLATFDNVTFSGATVGQAGFKPNPTYTIPGNIIEKALNSPRA